VEASEAECVALFAAGQGRKQLMVGYGAELFCPVSQAAQRWMREDTLFQPGEVDQGDAVSAVEVVEDVKELGFVLLVRAAVLGVLHRRIGAFSFMNSHRCLLLR
jgi:hypothetical protein